MSALDSVRRMAAELLGVGVNRVWIDPEQLDRASSAITKEDVRRLIKDGVVKVKPAKGISRGRWRKARRQRKKGLRKGSGSRKGPVFDEKRLWIAKVRALRSFLANLRRRRIITRTTYRKLYIMVKSGMFESKSQLKTYIREKGLARALP